ncbi:hypothetical protein LOAG_13818 [Loa loa]|uniref:Uncharacterized protein n=1 Tax=Loa loa TaxID=7209 RepID=A0A1S0TJ94_LOALO|nr:hypothetical protein LOAG_13818 [Loa loa]EFO14698.1 hypothetical protein LOAG_13818 [Loa loa]
MQAYEMINGDHLELTIWSHEYWKILDHFIATKLWPECIKYKLCGIEITESQYYDNIDAVCELHYGSLIHDSTEMYLNWASNDIQQSNLPCSIEFDGKLYYQKNSII